MKFIPFTKTKTSDSGASRHEPEGVRILADVYWRALLVLAVLLTTAALVYGVWGLMRVLNILGSTIKTAPPPPPALNRPMLDKTIRGFDNRRTNFERLRTAPGEVIPDPSI